MEEAGKRSRWNLRLMEYDLEMILTAGVKHQATDALSRLYTRGTDDSKIEDDIPVTVFTTRPQFGESK